MNLSLFCVLYNFYMLQTIFKRSLRESIIIPFRFLICLNSTNLNQESTNCNKIKTNIIDRQHLVLNAVVVKKKHQRIYAIGVARIFLWRSSGPLPPAFWKYLNRQSLFIFFTNKLMTNNLDSFSPFK